MSDQQGGPDLPLIAHHLRQVLDDVRTLCEDMKVLPAIVLRQDATLSALLNEVRAS